jgi:hypothetical protein
MKVEERIEELAEQPLEKEEQAKLRVRGMKQVVGMSTIGRVDPLVV